jgi:hypothetical protein
VIATGDDMEPDEVLLFSKDFSDRDTGLPEELCTPKTDHEEWARVQNIASLIGLDDAYYA